MMNLVLLTAVLSLGTPATEPTSVALDAPQPVIAVCSDEAPTTEAVSEAEPLMSSESAQPEDALGCQAARVDQDLYIRYCCTTQQQIACANIGGTTTCRTGVCQCQF